MSDARLVIVTGPVGGGKSTVAAALAGVLRSEGQRVAVIDLDVVYTMARQKEGFGEMDVWPVARRASGALARSLFAQGYDRVIVEGEFFSADELEDVVRGGEEVPAPRVFTLDVSYAEALRRVGLDASRGASKDPVLLKQFHDAFVAALPYLRTRGEVVDAEGRAAREVAGAIAMRLMA